MINLSINESVKANTCVYGLIGNPVNHSLSPYIHNTLSSTLNINSVYVTYPVSDSMQLEDAVRGAHSLSIKGFNVTIPYKKDIIEHLHSIDNLANKIGAVNTLKYTENGYIGYNTDIYGIQKTFEINNISLINKNVLILGAGGAACAAIVGAINNGAKNIFIANRSINNAKLLANNLKKHYNIKIECLEHDKLLSIPLSELQPYYIIQTTSVGLTTDELPLVNHNIVENSCGVFDVIYKNSKTKILQLADACSLQNTDGLYMLVCQAVSAFEIWNNIVISNAVTHNIINALRMKLRSEYIDRR